MTRLTMLFIAVALVLPGAAIAMPSHDAGGTVLDKHGIDQAAQQRKATAVGRYYASFGKPKPLPAPQAPEPVASAGDGLSWSLAIGAGIALMLAGGGLGVYAGRTFHPRHLGA